MTLVRVLRPARLTRGLTLFRLAQAGLPAPALPPVTDARVHYKWTQTGHTSPARAVGILKQTGVHPAVVFGTSPELALRIKALAPHRVIPVLGPYDGRPDWIAWQFAPALADAKVGHGNVERLFGRPR